MARFRANVILTVEFETDDDPRAEIIRQMDKILPPDIEFSVANISRAKRTKVLGEFRPEEVFPFVGPSERQEYKIGDKSYFVRMDSHRYTVFANNPRCVACGLEGTKFLLEMPHDATQPHFNFYAVEYGQLVLLTKDHIRSKAYGGEDRHENYQTMCAICNCLKGSSRLSIEGVRELRRIYNESRRGGSKRQLALRVRKAKQRLVLPLQPGEREQHYSQKMRAVQIAENKASSPHLIALTALVLGQANGHLFAMSASEAAWQAARGKPVVAVGEIPRYAAVETTGEHRQRKVGIVHEGKQVFVYHGLLGYEDMVRQGVAIFEKT